MGTTFALRLSEGTTPVSSDVLKIMARIGAISLASCYRIIGLILSGHAALCGFKFCSNVRRDDSRVIYLYFGHIRVSTREYF